MFRYLLSLAVVIEPVLVNHGCITLERGLSLFGLRHHDELASCIGKYLGKETADAVTFLFFC